MSVIADAFCCCYLLYLLLMAAWIVCTCRLNGMFVGLLIVAAPLRELLASALFEVLAYDIWHCVYQVFCELAEDILQEAAQASAGC